MKLVICANPALHCASPDNTDRIKKGQVMQYYAHSLPNKPPEHWQRLDEHLRNVAEMAKGFAEKFGAGEWAYLV